MIEKPLLAWTAFVVKQAPWVLAALTFLTLCFGHYAVSAFKMNSDTGQLIRQDTDWKRTYEAFIDAFPQYELNSLVVVSGSKPEAVRLVARALSEDLRASPTFSRVYAPGVSDFVEDHGLLYAKAEDLNDIISKLADAQPFLAAVAGDSSLRGVLDLLQAAVTTDETLPAGMVQMADALDAAIKQALAGDATPIAWRDHLFQAEEGRRWYQIIFVQGRQDFGEQLPNREIMQALGQAVAGLQHPYKEAVDIRITGQVPLEHEEIQSALDSATLAGALALITLLAVLVAGVRSAKVIAATYLAMLTGLVWTAAFGMLAVGQFNTISIIFLVMFIGLGVDFALHLCLRYQEAVGEESREEAIADMTGSLGPAITLCGLTSAIGFLSFTPTDYLGLAEMGVISGGGMIIALLVSFTLIPAFFAVVAPPRPSANLPLVKALVRALTRHSAPIAYGALALAVCLGFIAAQARFDYSTLSIKNPEGEAMTTLTELIAEGIVTDYALTYMAPDMKAATELKPALEALPSVAEVKTPLDYLPAGQEDKLYLLDDASLLLAGTFAAAKDALPLADAALGARLAQLAGDIESYLARKPAESELGAALARLAAALREIAAAPPAARQLLTELVRPPLQRELDWLEQSLAAEPVTFTDLPEDTRARLVTLDGRALVSITPTEDLVPVEALHRFTTQVLAQAPGATGRPVQDLGIGQIVLGAFYTAIGIAVCLIILILLLRLRSLVDTLLVFLPLGMTALLTLAFSVLADLPLNMANVVVIPLIFGLGIDNGIHIVERFRLSHTVGELVTSSTPKAVFLSNLTTLSTFGALSASSHQGIHSIGVLLTVGLTGLMLLTLIALPALLQTFSSGHLLKD